jgi:hypothetical protein
MRDGMSGTPTATEVNTQPAYQPRTALGSLLWEIRGQILASGEPLLSWDEIEREVFQQRQHSRPQE